MTFNGDAITLLSGTLWITAENDVFDHVLVRPGDTYQRDRPGRIVVQALSPARVAVTPTA